MMPFSHIIDDFSHFAPLCFSRRVTIFSGHYGSGKTNASVAYALALRAHGKRVNAFDLDVVNPYFRTKDAAETLEKNGVGLISSPYANTNVDIPAMPAEFYRITDDRTRFAVVDVGGDDRGALALGRFREGIISEGDYSFLYVLNRFRPETRDLEGAVRVFEEIEKASGMKFTGVAGSPNLGRDTTAETVNESLFFAEEFAEKVGLKVEFTCVLRHLCDKIGIDKKLILPISPISTGDWE